jgi:hypothetical protein
MLQRRTGEHIGPGKYIADNIKTIYSAVNKSHHAVNIPTMGRPWPKETTVQGYGDLCIYDPTYASEKYKKDNRDLKQQKILHLAKLSV